MHLALLLRALLQERALHEAARLAPPDVEPARAGLFALRVRARDVLGRMRRRRPRDRVVRVRLEDDGDALDHLVAVEARRRHDLVVFVRRDEERAAGEAAERVLDAGRVPARVGAPRQAPRRLRVLRSERRRVERPVVEEEEEGRLARVWVGRRDVEEREDRVCSGRTSQR